MYITLQGYMKQEGLLVKATDFKTVSYLSYLLADTDVKSRAAYRIPEWHGYTMTDGSVALCFRNLGKTLTFFQLVCILENLHLHIACFHREAKPNCESTGKHVLEQKS